MDIHAGGISRSRWPADRFVGNGTVIAKVPVRVRRICRRPVRRRHHSPHGASPATSRRGEGRRPSPTAPRSVTQGAGRVRKLGYGGFSGNAGRILARPLRNLSRTSRPDRSTKQPWVVSRATAGFRINRGSISRAARMWRRRLRCACRRVPMVGSTRCGLPPDDREKVAASPLTLTSAEWAQFGITTGPQDGPDLHDAPAAGTATTCC